MTFPYLIPEQPMTQATVMIQHGDVPSPCLKLLWAKGHHEMSHRPFLSQGNGEDNPCSGQFPMRSQDTAKLSTQRAEGEHTHSQGPPLPSLFQRCHQASRQHHNSAWDPHILSRRGISITKTCELLSPELW